MRVTIIKSNKLTDLILPEVINGSYWIRDYDANGIKRNLISIEAENDKWKLVSNNDVYYIKDNIVIPFVYLENYRFFTIRNENAKEDILLYCSPTQEDYLTYELGSNVSNGISIGSDDAALLRYSVLEKKALDIKNENNKFFIYDNQSHYGAYLNGVRIRKKTEFKIGDIIFIMGLKVVLTVSNDEKGFSYYLAINNLNNHNFEVGLMSANINPRIDNSFEESDEELEFPMYDEGDYFHKAPRFVHSIESLEIKLDAPPAKQEEQNQSMLLTIGPMLTMSMTSVVSLWSTLNSVSQGDTTMEKATPQLVICGAMIASVFVWPLLARFYEKANSIRQEHKRKKRYKKYIDEKKDLIAKAKQEQTNSLINNYPNTKLCEETILKKYMTLWQKRIEDADFLTVNLGNGTYQMKIDIKYPEEHFSMVDDKLKNIVQELGSAPKMLENVPVTYSLFDNFISGLAGDLSITPLYVKQLLLQILAFHSYDDLKLAIFTDDEKEYNWQVFKDAPHMFTDDKSLRFFASNDDEYKEISYYLERIYNARAESAKSNTLNKHALDKIYLIVIDNFKKIRDFEVIRKILENKNNLGFILLILDKKVTNFPDQIMSFIELSKEAGSLHVGNNYNEVINFAIDPDLDIDYDVCIKNLANVPIEMRNNAEGMLPNRLGFLEMYDVGKIEQLNAPLRWEKSSPMLNLAAPVGFGKNGEKISIDLHEKYHGPHGLIAGMTGSGKSEFIITYILSMAVNYHPYEVQFILIDYKGGGLAGAFENKITGLKLPHLVGTITNLDANEIKRSLASIESELKRRQALFNKAREISGESTIDIYKYQRMYRDKQVEEPVSHLFIISDEFAELKNQQPEFMEQLISTARIGRSLGVHLILATQKPSGVVDPQIWSNTRFRVCLRVQETGDSNEVIKKPDAAYLKQTGRFYFQVGYDEVFVLGQAAWAGGKYIPREIVQKNIDSSITFINNIGYPIKTIETKRKMDVAAEQGEELLNIVKYLDEIAKNENIVTKPLWLERIPAFIRVRDLITKYHYEREPFMLNPIIGEYDIPSRQEQKLLTLPLSREGNALIYGVSGSGKENFITTMIYETMLDMSPEEVNYYILDFGAQTLKMFDESPIVGDVLYPADEEKIANLYKMLNDMIEERRKLFQDYNGDYLSYVKNSNNKLPYVVVVINNFEAYQEAYSNFDDTLVMLTRECNKYGIYFVITVNTPNGLRYKLRQNFNQLFALQQNNEDDYTTILGSVHKTYPATIFGRGIIKTDDVYEFQTACVCELDNISNFVKEECKNYKEKYSIKAKKVPVLPEVVTYNEIKDYLDVPFENVIGINKHNLEPSKFNFYKNYISIISALDIYDTNTLVNKLINEFIVKKDFNIVIINASEYTLDDSQAKYVQIINENFEEYFGKLNSYIEENLKLYKENNYDKKVFKDKKPILNVIIGLDNLKNRLGDDFKTKFGTVFSDAKDLGIVSYIFVDSIDNIKKYEIESWYKNSVNNNSGIWVGNGINDQYTLKYTQKLEEMKMDVPRDFCFVINRGKVEFVKYITELTLK